MYPLGVLFGLGFDTATEVALLFLAAGAAGAGLPFYAILCLPILFAAGMSLLDTIDGSFMNFAYGWAFSKPVRKVFYNLTITGLSVAVALVIGTIELAGSSLRQLNAQAAFWSGLENVDINTLGFIIVGMFVADLGGRARGLALRPDRGALGRPDAGRSAGADAMTVAPRRAAARRSTDDRRRDRGAARSAVCGCRRSRRLVLEALFAADGPVSAEHSRSDWTLDVDLGLPQPRDARAPRPVATSTSATGPGSMRSSGDRRARVPVLRALRHGAHRAAPTSSSRCASRIRTRFGYDARFTHFAIVGTCAACAGPAHGHDDDHTHEHSHGDYVHSHPHDHAGDGHEHRH